MAIWDYRDRGESEALRAKLDSITESCDAAIERARKVIAATDPMPCSMCGKPATCWDREDMSKAGCDDHPPSTDLIVL